MNTNIILSNLQFDKISEVSSILVECWKSAYKGLINDDYLSSLKDNHWVEFLEKSMQDKTAECVIAERDNEILGVSVFGKSITEKFPNDGEVISLYVRPRFIGQRLGNLLFAKAEQSVKEQGYSHCTICTFTENIKAITFYKTHGYEVVSQDEMITMGTQDLAYVIMRKSL